MGVGLIRFCLENKGVSRYLPSLAEEAVVFRKHRSLEDASGAQHAMDFGHRLLDCVPVAVVDHVPGKQVIEARVGAWQVRHQSGHEMNRPRLLLAKRAGEINAGAADVEGKNTVSQGNQKERMAADIPILRSSSAISFTSNSGFSQSRRPVLYEVAFKIEVIEKSGEVTSPHPAGFGRARPRARPSARRWRRLPSTCWATAAAPYRAAKLRGGAPSQKIGRELEASSTGPMCKREPERSEGSEGKAPRAFQLLLVLT